MVSKILEVVKQCIKPGILNFPLNNINIGPGFGTQVSSSIQVYICHIIAVLYHACVLLELLILYS